MAETLSKKWVILIGIATILLSIFLGIVISLLLNKDFKNPLVKTPKTGNAVISGSIDFHGIAPPNSTIEIVARDLAQNEFTTVAFGIAPVEGATWSFSTAVSGTAYEIKANLKENGQLLYQSDPIVVAAPAYNEVLLVTSSKSDNTNPTTISGTFDLNGYLPSGSKINILSRKQGETTFNEILTNLPAVDESVWNWVEAINGTTYEIQAQLIYAGKVISESQNKTVTAPSQNEVLRINSTAKSPISSPTIISGSINLNGISAQNSSISIAERVSGTGSWTTVISNISPTDGVAWSWNNAIPGTSYDLQAFLITNGNTVAQSQVLTVTAPAVKEILVLNLTNQPPAPGANLINHECLGQNSNNLWQVKINYNTNTAVNNAVSYWLTVGDSSTGSNYVNSVTSPNNPKQPQSFTTGFVFNSNQTYYAQWAYTTCANCSTFSPFSPSLQIICSPQTPTNTPTPTPTTAPPTNTPVPTLTPVPSPTDTPTPTIPPAPTN